MGIAGMTHGRAFGVRRLAAARAAWRWVKLEIFGRGGRAKEKEAGEGQSDRGTGVHDVAQQ